MLAGVVVVTGVVVAGVVDVAGVVVAGVVDVLEAGAWAWTS